MGLAKEALYMALVLSAPPVLAAMVVGLVISILQATTQLQEQTLTFVPKLVVVVGTLFYLGPQILEQLRVFTSHLLMRLPQAM